MTRSTLALSLVAALGATLAVAEEPRPRTNTVLSSTTGTVETAAPSAPTVPVIVTNFPATQTVNGTVNVGNLPTDGNGDIRVACSQPAYSVTYDLLDEVIPLPPGEYWYSAWVESDQYSKAALAIEQACVTCALQWRYSASDPSVWGTGPYTGNVDIAEIFGPEVLRFRQWGGGRGPGAARFVRGPAAG